MVADYIGIMLVLFFTLVFSIGLFQSVTTLQSRNKVLTLRNGITFALTCSAFLRVIFFIKVCIETMWDITFMLLLFYLPLFLQHLAISLLLVFYAASFLEKSPWSRVPFRLCVVANIILFALDVTIAVLTAQSLQGYRRTDGGDLTLLYVIYTSSIDFGIVILLGYFGYHFRVQSLNNSGNLLATWSSQSLKNFNYINIVLFFTYIFRGVFSILFYAIPEWQGRLEYNGPHPPTGVIVLLFFLFVEIIPSLLVLIMLFNIGVNTSRPKYEYSDSIYFDCEYCWGWLMDIFNGDMNGNVGYEAKDHVYLGLPPDFDARLLSMEDARVHEVLEGNGGGDNPLNTNDSRYSGGDSSDNSQASSSYRNSLTANLSATLSEENHMTQTKQIPHSPQEKKEETQDSSTTVEKYSPDDDTTGILAVPGSYEEHGGGEGPYARRMRQLLGHSLRTPSPQIMGGSLRSTSPQIMMSVSPIKVNGRESPSTSQNLGVSVEEPYLYNNYMTDEDTIVNNNEKYSEFISPRDILLAHKGGRKK